MIEFILNDHHIVTGQSAGLPLLDFIRYQRHLVGTKIGCREGDCGACVVLVGEIKKEKLHYQSMCSCLTPLGNAQGKHIVTIEGINRQTLTPVQKAIIEEGGTQCGFCTVGFVVSLTGFCLRDDPPAYNAAIAAIDGNICRCTGYKSLERAAGRIVQQLNDKEPEAPIPWLVSKGFLPEYFIEIKERLEMLVKPPLNGSSTEQVVYLGGGTDLFVQRPEDLLTATVRHVFDHPELKGIEQRGQNIYIGASATAEDMQSSPLLLSLFPSMKDYMKLVSSTPIRNMGTIAGNIVNASPIGDLTIFFLALDATILLSDGTSTRRIRLADFYKGYKDVDKAPEEYVEALYFSMPETEDLFNFEKVCKRTHLDIASVNTACRLQAKDGVIILAQISAGGVAPIPKYLKNTSEALVGRPVDPNTLSMANEVMQSEIAPISDARGSAAYKRLLLRQLFYAHFLKFFPHHLTLHQLTDP